MAVPTSRSTALLVLTAICFLTPTLAIIDPEVVSSNSSEVPHPLHLENGALNAIAFEGHTWTGEDCFVPGAYRDFYVEVDESHSHDNLFVELVVTPFLDVHGIAEELLPDAVTLKMWEDAIPVDRKSDLYQDWSTNSAYSLAVNANEIHDGRYYFVEFSHALLEEHQLQDHNRVCAGELMYHYANVNQTHIDKHENLKFTVCTPDGSEADLTLMTRVDEPPLRIASPMKLIKSGGGCATFDVCADQLEEGKTWLGVYATKSCTEYSVEVHYFKNADVGHEACVPEHGDDEAISDGLRIEIGHSTPSR